MDHGISADASNPGFADIAGFALGPQVLYLLLLRCPTHHAARPRRSGVSEYLGLVTSTSHNES
jgi:hypothetical protein